MYLSVQVMKMTQTEDPEASSNGVQVFKKFQIKGLDDPGIKIHSSPF